ncbi:hypothetical protein ACWEIJ_05700 [Lentzea sp. NPDC004789]
MNSATGISQDVQGARGAGRISSGQRAREQIEGELRSAFQGCHPHSVELSLRKLILVARVTVCRHGSLDRVKSAEAVFIGHACAVTQSFLA